MINILNKCPSPILSILICNLDEREELFRKLMLVLYKQVENNNVEIIIANHPRGTVNIGEKRNLLVAAASGKYVCFIDDDDLVSDNYVSLILIAAEFDSDCIGMTGIYIEQGKANWSFRHSMTVTRWCKDKQNRIYYRTPNHLNPIKKSIVVQCPFPEIQYGEDKCFSDLIKPLINTETFLEYPIYYYIFVKDK